MSDYYHRIQNINHRKTNAFADTYGDGTWLNYILEAMKPLRNELTQSIISQASFLEQLLKDDLLSKNINIEFLQIGGTSYNTHISDKGKVDLLMIYKGYNGESAQNANSTKLEDIIILKDFTKKIIQKKFPEVLLDDSQPLALEMSIQSWSCNFCLYFGFWHNSRAFASGFYPNSIQILNKETFKFESLNPILALHQLNKKDEVTNGNAKTLIRVLKNLKVDSKESITLTGHQISSIVYSMDDYSLAKPNGQILFLLLECSLFLKRLNENPFARKGIKSMEDNSIITPEKEESFIHGIIILKKELDKIIKHLVLEIDLYTNINEVVNNHHLVTET